MTDSPSSKALSQQQFGSHAENYVKSTGHAKGAELDLFLEWASPQPDWHMLDVATGGGHVALKFAPHIEHIIASDLTPAMLEKASEFIQSQGIQHIQFRQADAEKLPFEDGQFDLVTCRIAPHHFEDAFRFMLEVARVLKPNGIFLLQDHVLPEDDKAARYIDSFERLRDPSHHRAYAEYEWRGMFLDAGLMVEATTLINREASLVTWAERMGCDADVIQRLQILLYQVPEAAKEWIKPRAVGTPDATFLHQYIILKGRKPA